jgi:hypothetical protein
MIFLEKPSMSLRKNTAFLFSAFCLALLVLFLPGCDFGQVGGAGKTITSGLDDPAARSLLETFSGVWYSHYGAMRTDGYRIGKVGNMSAEMGAKLLLFPGFSAAALVLNDGYTVSDDDYYVFYDDTVYGENESGAGGNGGWEGLVTRFIGIVRAVNFFPKADGSIDAGAVIIEYLDHAYPTWADLSATPFIAVFYRIIDKDCVRMANPIDLAALTEWIQDTYLGTSHYAVETATLAEAKAKFTAENGDEFINWGVVLPQVREKRRKTAYLKPGSIR